MHFFDEESVIAATPWVELIDGLASALAEGGITSPDRTVFDLDQPDGSVGSLLMMPSWSQGSAPTPQTAAAGLGSVGIKLVTYYPANAGTDVPTINAVYVLFDGQTGRPTAAIDGDALTARRTAAISALAGRYLARPGSSSLLVVGTGQLAPNLAAAHAAGHDLTSIEIWGRNPEAAQRVAAQLVENGLPARATTDLAAGVAKADIVSCATGATSPLVQGRWLKPGAHLDLVGSFRPDMRESDDDAITRSTVFVDTAAGAVLAGDLAQPIESGLFAETGIAAELADLAAGRHQGRTSNDQNTFFKSAGFAAADLAAATMVVGTRA